MVRLSSMRFHLFLLCVCLLFTLSSNHNMNTICSETAEYLIENIIKIQKYNNFFTQNALLAIGSNDIILLNSKFRSLIKLTHLNSFELRFILYYPEYVNFVKIKNNCIDIGTFFSYKKDFFSDIEDDESLISIKFGEKYFLFHYKYLIEQILVFYKILKNIFKKFSNLKTVILVSKRNEIDEFKYLLGKIYSSHILRNSYKIFLLRKNKHCSGIMGSIDCEKNNFISKIGKLNIFYGNIHFENINDDISRIKTGLLALIQNHNDTDVSLIPSTTDRAKKLSEKQLTPNFCILATTISKKYDPITHTLDLVFSRERIALLKGFCFYEEFDGKIIFISNNFTISFDQIPLNLYIRSKAYQQKKIFSVIIKTFKPIKYDFHFNCSEGKQVTKVSMHKNNQELFYNSNEEISKVFENYKKNLIEVFQ